jgi:hypothetical protein
VLEDWDLQRRLRLSGGESNADELPMYFIQSLPVYHSARSSLWRTLRHSWYWGLPSKQAWLSGNRHPFRFLGKPFLRWLELPRLFMVRIKAPLRAAWSESPIRALAALPFLAATVLVWSVALILDKGQPSPDQTAPA